MMYLDVSTSDPIFGCQERVIWRASNKDTKINKENSTVPTVYRIILILLLDFVRYFIIGQLRFLFFDFLDYGTVRYRYKWESVPKFQSYE